MTGRSKRGNVMIILTLPNLLGVRNPHHRLDAPQRQAGDGMRFYPPARSEGQRAEGDHAKHGGGGTCSKETNLSADAPSTALRAVPLPRFAGQDELLRQHHVNALVHGDELGHVNVSCNAAQRIGVFSGDTA
jgi:hypothetical protein